MVKSIQKEIFRWGAIIGLVVLLAGLAAGVCRAEDALDSPDPGVRLRAVLKMVKEAQSRDVKSLARMLQDENSVVRRTAMRGLRAVGRPAGEALEDALKHADAEVRMGALLGLVDLNAVTVRHLSVVLADAGDPALRHEAVVILAGMTPQTPEVRNVLQEVANGESAIGRDIALNALFAFPYFREVPSIRETIDQIVRVARKIPLAADGWKLKFDPGQNGHTQHWFDPSLDDSDWQAVSIGKFWDDFGHKHKSGVGWYRGRFTLPAKPEFSAVELCFQAVDESTWVWVNGEYAGQHDIGPDGWTVPFQIDVTPFLKWGEENHVTVRVLNTAYAGGIWKRVTIQVLKAGN